MKISKENYEAYFLDYYENSLDAGQVAELMIFLEENPDLKETFEDFDISISVEADSELQFSNRENLKKTKLTPFAGIDDGNYEQFILEDIEGVLSTDKSAELKGFLSVNPKIKLEYNLLKSTFLVPDEAIVYENKSELKKGGIFTIYSTQVYYALSVAATVIILLGFYFGISSKFDSKTRLSKLNRMDRIHPSLTDEISVETRLLKVNSKVNVKVFESKITESEIRRGDDIFSASFQKREIAKVTSPEENREIIIVSRNAFEGAFKQGLNSISPNSKPDKAFISRFIAGLSDKIISGTRNDKKSFIEFTVDGYNMMADKEVEVRKQTDENGNVIAYNVVGDNMQFSRKKRNTLKE